MAAAYLPPIVPTPFGTAIATKPYIFANTGHHCSNTANGYHYSSQQGHLQTPRAASLPLNLPPEENLTRKEENFECRSLSRIPFDAIDRPAKCLHKLPQKSSQSSIGRGGLTRTPLVATETFPVFDDPQTLCEHPFRDPCNAGVDRSSDQSWRWPSRDLQSPAALGQIVHQGAPPLHPASLGEKSNEVEAVSGVLADMSFAKATGTFRRWASTFRHRQGQSSVAEVGLQDTASTLPYLTFPPRRHSKRASNASSRFVTTVKTASLSNDSMSVLPRAHRYSRLSDTRGNRSTDPRSSLDSYRPISLSSSDDGALRRGFKRLQIVQEILHSEESYVSDLKALHTLFSTLLISIPSISAQTRNSIQRNVTEMLHLHEQIVDELHRAALKATLREWRYFASPSRLATKGQTKWQSLNTVNVNASPPKQAPLMNPRNTMKVRSRSASTYTADPEEAADVAKVFKKHISRFSVYEEYCAKYEVMVQELANSQKLISHWSSYQAGMEALTNSVASLNQRAASSRKCLTPADLLVRPIQRICKYPLLFDDLHNHLSVVDCPTAHAEVEELLTVLRETVKEINQATDDPKVRDQIQRRWLLQDRLTLGPESMNAGQFRLLGYVLLCGVLHVAYQTSSRVQGKYMLCMIFKEYLVVAAPAAECAKFDIVATIALMNARVVSAEDGRGLQCHTALFSWKVVFESDGQVFELLFSACSATEQEQWQEGVERGKSLLGLQGAAGQSHVPGLSTTTSLGLKPVASVPSQAETLTRRPSIQRAATVGARTTFSQVIIRHTHKPQDRSDLKQTPAEAVYRSQSLLTTHRITVLAPKRSERVRLEQSLADVWTRERLPFPGMSLSRSGNIIRASAGSLVRKLSLASIHSPFAKRSTATSLPPVSPRFPPHASVEDQHDIEQRPREELSSHASVADGHDHGEPDEGEEVSREAVSPPLSTSTQLSSPPMEKPKQQRTRRVKKASKAGTKLVTKMPLAPLVDDEAAMVEDRLGSKKKKRWSHSVGMLRNISVGGVRHLLYSSK